MRPGDAREPRNNDVETGLTQFINAYRVAIRVY